MDQINLAGWTGRTIEEESRISSSQAARIQATLARRQSSSPQEGDPLPPLWHWMAFTPTEHMDELGGDGHPKLGSFLPPIRFSRRMWASGKLRFHAPLSVGETMHRTSVVRDIVEREGATGSMVFVTVDHMIFGSRGLAIQERQDIVYLPIPDRYNPPKERPMPEHPEVSASRSVSETLLFRFSALTFNAHRIHYDLPYAQEVEHYPGLVVHGPLQACWLMMEATEHKGRVPNEFHFRGVHPMFAHDKVDIAGTWEDGALILCTGQNGRQCTRATAIWEETV